MKLSLEVHGPLEEQLAAAAKRLNISVEEVAQVALRDLLARSDVEFEKVTRRILEKNGDLYKRLA